MDIALARCAQTNISMPTIIHLHARERVRFALGEEKIYEYTRNINKFQVYFGVYIRVLGLVNKKKGLERFTSEFGGM